MKKKFLILSMAVVISLLTVFIGSADVSAYSSTKKLTMNSNWGYSGTSYMQVNDSGGSSTIQVTYIPHYQSDVWVKATVQRYYSGSWHNVESKSGSAKNYWGATKKNFNTAFYGYANKKQKVRVRFQLSDPSSKSHILQTGYSYSWVK